MRVFVNSHRLSSTRANENESRRESVKSDCKREKLSPTFTKNLSTFKVDESASFDEST